jgi:hypothetical protein
MIDALRRIAAQLRRLWRLLVLFVVLRLAAGVALIAVDGGVAAGIELTLIVAAAVAVYGAVALAVRRWAPPRRIS